MPKFEVAVDEAATCITNFDHGTPVALEDLAPHIDSASIIWVQFRLPSRQWLPLSWFKKSAVNAIVSCACEYLSDELGDGKCTAIIDGRNYSVDVTDQRARYTRRNGEKLVAEFRFIVLNAQEFRALRRASRVLILYHQTSFAAAAEILKTQTMLRGRSGMAGGGIYFAVNPSDTEHKAHQHGVVLKAHVHVGHMKTIDVNGDTSLTGEKLALEGVDSVCIPRVNGLEVVVYFSDQVHSISEVTRYAADYAVQNVVVLPPRIGVVPVVMEALADRVPLNAWNAFQQANAGKGWTQNDMLAQYKKYKMALAGPSMEDGAHKTGQATAAAAAPSKVTPTNTSSKPPTTHVVSNASTAPVNSWNAFQHEHAGRGWSKERMLMEYEAHKARKATAAAAPFKATLANPSSMRNTTRVDPAQPHRVTHAPSWTSIAAPANSWNAHQHAHAGLGYSRAEMLGSYYAASRMAGSCLVSHTPSGAGGSRYTPTCSSSYPSGGGGGSHSVPSNPWNAFQAAHGGQGYSRAELRSMYHASRTA